MVPKKGGICHNGVPIDVLRSLFITLQGTYDIVDMVWKIRNLYQREKGG